MGGKGGCALWSLGCDEVGTPPISAATPAQSTVRTSQTSESCWLSAHRSHTFWTERYFSAAMRGHFSIEWMAQSSQTAGTDAVSGPAACGTHSESLPGFYCRQKSENVPEERRNQSLKTFNQHQISQITQGKFNLMQKICNTQLFKVSFNIKMMHCPDYQFIPCMLLHVVLVWFIRISQMNISLKCEFNDSVNFCLPVTTEAGFSSGTEEETSGYESEGGHSFSPSAPTECSTASSPSSPPLGRRPRTAFTAEQICSMERAFKRNAYLGTQDKAELCKKLNLSDKQVEILTQSFLWSIILDLKCVYIQLGNLASWISINLSDQKLVPEQEDEVEEDDAGRAGSCLSGKRCPSVHALPRATGLQTWAIPQVYPRHGGSSCTWGPNCCLLHSSTQPAVQPSPAQCVHSASRLILPVQQPPRSCGAPSNNLTDGLLPNLHTVLLRSMCIYFYFGALI